MILIYALVLKWNSSQEKRFRDRRTIYDYDDLKEKLKYLPQQVDWRNKGIVSEIRNQGKPGINRKIF